MVGRRRRGAGDHLRVFVTGATGAIGRCLLPRLAHAGHEVTAMTRSEDRARALREQGFAAVVADALDGEAVRRAVVAARPEAVVHQATDLTSFTSPRRIAQQFAVTNRLRAEGTDHLLAAAREAGARRFVAQSYIGLPSGAEPPSAYAPVLRAIEHLEAAVTAFPGGVALRYGSFYGPGTAIAPDGSTVRDIRRRRFPVVGSGGGMWSFIHVDDAAAATVAAVEGDGGGILHVVDDRPVAVREWVPAVAEMVGAPAPRRVPAWMARLAAGRTAAIMMTELRGVSNADARSELGWAPQRPHWREGFREVLQPPADVA